MVVGAGAAGVACTEILLAQGVGDVVVSVNLMSAEVMERWPGLPEPEAAPAKKKGMLDKAQLEKFLRELMKSSG